MDSNAFFKFIWRLNALAIAVLTGFGLFAVGTLYWPSMRNEGRGLPQSKPVAAEQTDDIKIEPTIGRFERAGQTLYVASLAAWKEDRPRAGSSFRYGYVTSAPIINLIYFDHATGQTRRLFADDKGLIATSSNVNAAADGESDLSRRIGTTSEPAAKIIRYVRADTDGDRMLTSKDRADLLMARQDGLELKTIAENIDADDAYSLSRKGDTTRAIFYSRDGKQFMRELDPVRMFIGAEVPISP